MPRFIEGQYYRSDQVEPDGNGGWRVKGHKPITAIEKSDGGGAPGVVVTVEADVVEPVADVGLDAPDAVAPETKDDDPSTPGPTPPGYATKMVTAKAKPPRDKGDGYDTK